MPEGPADTEILPGSGDSLGGSRYQLSRAAAVLIALALGLGLLIGRASVHTRHSPTPKADPTSTPISPSTSTSPRTSSVPFGPISLTDTGAKCAVQRGRDLVLGVEARNVSSVPITLEKLGVRLPLGGMSTVSRGVGSCGQLHAPQLKGYEVAPGGVVWLAVTVRPAEECPAPDPVQLTAVVNDPSGRRESIDLVGFADLGDVPWSGCPTRS